MIGTEGEFEDEDVTGRVKVCGCRNEKFTRGALGLFGLRKLGSLNPLNGEDIGLNLN